MGHFKEETTLPANCDALLVQVNRIYREIETLYQAMQHDLSATSILKVMQTVGTMNALQHDAQTIDSLIAQGLKTVPTLSESTDALLGERKEILTKLYQDNQKISNRAKNVQSLLRHEITSISTSHKAIKGYKPAGAERKYIIRDSF